MTPGALRAAIGLLLIAMLPVGCGVRDVEITYGRIRGSSINGTGTLAEILRERGFEVRPAVRMTPTLADWADVLVRFAPHPGPPGKDEGRWLFDWLKAEPGRKVVYIPLDFDAEPEFWDAMLAAQPKDAKPEVIAEIKKKRDRARPWVGELPPKPKEVAGAADWFALEPKPAGPSACKTLEGPWAEGVDAGAAAVSKHEAFRVEGDEPVLLSGDGSPLAISWTLDNGSQVLAIANASFLLNASLLNRARRPLTIRAVEWIGTGPGHVAFVEGLDPLAEGDGSSTSPFHLFKVAPFGWIAAHLLIFLLLLALSMAVRLGRPIPDPPSGVERPSAHPEALGALLARTGRADAARALLEAYRRWRHPSHVAGRTAPAHPILPMSHPLMTESDEIEFLDDPPPADDPNSGLGGFELSPAGPAPPSPIAPSDGPVASWAARVLTEVNKVYVGQDDLVRGVLAALLADGHVLIESVPGLGKTLLVRALGRVLGCAFNRIQFTPDLMPSDVTGSPVYDERVHDFRFRPGPVFTQLLLADEINRAPAKTHSALLEIMQEYRVTVDGTAHPITKPFLVLATQNPIESEGTYNLPEAQLDRFLFKLVAGYPSATEEANILRLHTMGSSPDALLANDLVTVTNPQEVLEVQERCGSVLVDDRVLKYIAALVRRTREWPTFSLGASPRAGVAILRGARAVAALEGRDFAVPDDVQEVAPWALRHRVMLTPEAEVEGQGADDLLAELIRSVEVPRS